MDTCLFFKSILQNVAEFGKKYQNNKVSEISTENFRVKEMIDAVKVKI